MKCIECGHELKDGAIFCIRCGAMQVSMDGSRLEKQEWPTVEPQSDGSAWRSADSSRPSVNAQHSREFAPAPKRGGGRIAAIIIAIIAVLAIVAFALSQCMGPIASGADESSSAESSASSSASASSASSSSTSASASASSSSSSASSASSASAASESAESADADAADGAGAAAEPVPTIVGEQSSAPQQTAPAAAPAPSAPAPSGGDYVLSDSDTRVYSQGELEGYSASDLYYARNEIFARHGRMFQRDDLQNYFNSKDWYDPQYTPEQWNNLPNQLNSTEIANANLIMEVEKAKGSPYV